jgi:ribosome-binding protein aMBF1 (putative translation factor)
LNTVGRDFGQKISQERTKLGLTQTELASMISEKLSVVQSYEKVKLLFSLIKRDLRLKTKQFY